MASLLLAGSAAYAALKWRTLLPALTQNAGNLLDIAKWSAEPVVVALATGAIAGYAIASEDELTEITFVEELGYALLAVALGTLLWPAERHWSLSSTALGSILTAKLIQRDNTRLWSIGTTACVIGYISIVRHFLKERNAVKSTFAKDL